MKKKKRVAAWILRILVIAIAAAAIQLVLLNWSSRKLLLDDRVPKHQVLLLQDFKLVNWAEQDQITTSLQNPMLLCENINMYIDRIQIDLKSDPLPQEIQIHYTSGEHTSFDGGALVAVQGGTPTTTAQISDEVKDLRIDLGHDPGMILQSLQVTINPVEIRFSIAIEVAVIMIVLGGRLLFSLQHEPDYGLSDKLNERREAKKGDAA